MRLFIAATFPPEILGSLNDRVAALQPKLPPASWVRPGAQHLTYAFLGEQHESVVEIVARNAGAQLRTIASFEASLHGCGFFPNRRNARVGWVGVEPEERFAEVARVVREGVTASGVELDRNEFKPHLTLMRMRERWPPLSIATFERGLSDYRSAPFAVRSVTLYSSRLGPGGAVHTPLREFPLA